MARVTIRGRRPGDKRVLVARRVPEEIQVTQRRRLRRPFPAPLVLVGAFAAMIAFGTGLLSLPIATATGEPTPIIDTLFIATSAVCVTGLVVVDTGTHWSPFGQVVILLLIQAGGFGIMTGSTVLLALVVGRRTSLRNRVIVQQSLGGLELGSVMSIVRQVAIFTIVAELIGAAILSVAFVANPEAGGVGNPLGIWWGIFHSVSAFNNAGFDVTGGFRSIAPFATNWVIVTTHAVLLILGGLGWAILGDAVGRRRWGRMALETRIVLLSSAALLVVGTLIFAATEWENPATLGPLGVGDRVLNSFFQSATARTAGFSTLPTGAHLDGALLLLMVLMFIGAASGSTGGGIKVNTFAVLVVAMMSSARGLPSASAMGRRIQHVVVYRALAVALLFIVVVVTLAFVLSLRVDAPFIEVVFESVSATGTVGLSTGITTDLDPLSRVLVTVTMFAGRLGPLTLVLALAARAHAVSYRPAVESIRIG